MLKPFALLLAVVLPVASTTALAPQGRVVEVKKPGAAVAKKKQDAKRADLIVQVVPLEYTKAKDVARSISRKYGLHRKRPGALVIIPHREGNAVLMRGTRKQVTNALDEIARIDVQPALHSDRAMTQVVSLEYGSADEIAKTLNSFLDTAGTDDLRIEAHAPNDMILIRGTRKRVMAALDLIAQLDMKPAKEKSKPKWVTLEHTRAAEVVPTLIRFLDLAKNAGPNRGLMIDANKEHNAVVLRGTAEQTKQAIELIAQIDYAAGKKLARKAAKKAGTVR